MSTKQVDLLNIGLIFVAAILAYHFPMELFIFAYAILGPLHYITEINWLNNNRYFTNQNKFIWLSIGIFAALMISVPKLYFAYYGLESSSTIGEILRSVDHWSNSAIFVTLALAIGFLFVRKWIGWVILTVVAITGAILLNSTELYATIVGLLVPTVIHVYIFTLLFMIYGALKSKSNFGFIPVILAIVIPVVFVFINIDPSLYEFNDTIKSTYVDNRLYTTPLLFGKFIGASDGTAFYFYEDVALRLMMFISFIYMYHYLNWFSKTTIIAWHKNLTIRRSIVIVVLWIVMVALFYVDFALGFIVALFFSFLHVILEFPLNMVSIKSIFKR